MRRALPTAFFPLVSLALSAFACQFVACTDSEGAPAGSAPDGGNVAIDAASPDGSTPAIPVLDPTKGSFAPARTALETFLAIGRRAELTSPDRFFPMRDPLFLASAISEVRRAAATADCVNGQYGCPAATSATQLVDEYVAYKAALGGALKKAQAAQHAWGRIALAETLLSALNLLEQAKALSADDVSILIPLLTPLTSAFATTATTPAGIYPDVSVNAPLYQLAFQQIRPAPAPSSAQLAAANDFIAAVFGRLAIGPKPEDPLAIGPKPEDPLTGISGRLRRGLQAQGLAQAIIVQGGEAGQVLDALPYFITVGAAPVPSAVDDYLGAVDALLPKVANSTAGDADWAAYAGAADKLAATFDSAAGVLGASSLVIGSVIAEGKPVPAEPLDVDPNAADPRPTSSLLRDNGSTLLAEPPLLRLRTAGPIRPALGERRSVVAMPAGVEVDLPARPEVATMAADDPLIDVAATAKASSIVLSWDLSQSSSPLDHVDIRIENTATKTTVFHKIYRRAMDETIATKTVIPVDASWFAPGGTVNDFQVKASAVDRLGRTSGIVCASLAMKVDVTSSFRSYPPGAGKCFTRGIDTGEAPLSLPPVNNAIVIGKYLGTSYRPTNHFTTTTIRFYNDSATPRRLRSLFTPDYSEIPSGIDLALRKDMANPAGVAPIDTGTIAAFSTVEIPLPANTPDKLAFTLFDADNGPAYRVRVTSGVPQVPKYW